MKIIFSPAEHSTNKYTKIIYDLLKDKNIDAYPLHMAFSNFELFRSVKIFHLNWFESLYDDNDLKKNLDFFKKVIILLILKICRKRIIWTMHNKISHEGRYLFLSKYLIKLLAAFSFKIIIHSKISEEFLLIMCPNVKRKIKYIPHPNYIDVYANNKLKNENYFFNEKLNLLFIGSIKPYKNIELLIDVVKTFDNEVSLTIAGKPHNNKYRQELLSYTENINNINLRLEYIEDDVLTNYVKEFDLLILPYDLQSSLNSGTVILAFSNHKSVICPEIGTISDVKEDKKHLLTYNYTSRREHFFELVKKIEEAINLKKGNSKVFVEWGNCMFNYVRINNDKNDIILKLVNIYNEENLI